MKPLVILVAAIPLAACQAADPVCRARNAPAFIPSAERYRTMTPRERREDAAHYDALARRCGWEP